MKTFDLEEAAAFLRVSKDSMRDMADSGKVPAAKIGPTSGYRWVFTDESLEEYMRHEIKAQTESRRRALGQGSIPIDKAIQRRKTVSAPGRKSRALPILPPLNV